MFSEKILGRSTCGLVEFEERIRQKPAGTIAGSVLSSSPLRPQKWFARSPHSSRNPMLTLCSDKAHAQGRRHRQVRYCAFPTYFVWKQAGLSGVAHAVSFTLRSVTVPRSVSRLRRFVLYTRCADSGGDTDTARRWRSRNTRATPAHSAARTRSSARLLVSGSARPAKRSSLAAHGLFPPPQLLPFAGAHASSCALALLVSICADSRSAARSAVCAS